MGGKVRRGLWRHMLPLPGALLGVGAEKGRKKIIEELAFMTAEHRAVHHFIVRQLPSHGIPMVPDFVADAVDLSVERVTAILHELEEHMTFLFRNAEGAVVWAYPVTVEQTPHPLTFSSGEKIYAAWAADTFATPFVQGRLRKEHLSVEVSSQCAHCQEPLDLTIDSDMNVSVRQDTEPLVFVPEVNLFDLDEPNIIESFWKLSVFLWSEEHAKEYRRKEHRVKGSYLTLEQITFLTPIIQGAVFGFEEEWGNPDVRDRG